MEVTPLTKGGNSMIRKLEHVGVMVKDLDRSIRFYTEIMGMKLVGRERLNESTELAFLEFPGSEDVLIELVARDNSLSEGIVNHIAFTVHNIEAEVERLKKAGVRMLDEKPRTILDGIKIAFFLGPDGEKLELFEPKAN